MKRIRITNPNEIANARELLESRGFKVTPPVTLKLHLTTIPIDVIDRTTWYSLTAQPMAENEYALAEDGTVVYIVDSLVEGLQGKRFVIGKHPNGDVEVFRHTSEVNPYKLDWCGHYKDEVAAIEKNLKDLQ